MTTPDRLSEADQLAAIADWHDDCGVTVHGEQCVGSVSLSETPSACDAAYAARVALRLTTALAEAEGKVERVRAYCDETIGNCQVNNAEDNYDAGRALVANDLRTILEGNGA